MDEIDQLSFGEQLRTRRKRLKLSQQHLADRLGVHRNTLVRWEQGDYLPESKTTVLELARYLKLDDQETRQLLEASLTALAPHWHVPLPRNPFFTGREGILEALHTQLRVDQAMALPQSSALFGLGGVGKTQIALEYAYRHALEYQAVFWMGAETEEQMVSDLLRIAEVLHLPKRDDKDQQRVIAEVHHWLISHSQWLLIVDNVEDLTLLDRFLPTVRSGVILLTTRSPTLGTWTYGLDLPPMQQEEGLLFLLRRAKILAPEVGNHQVRQFAEQHPASYTAATELVETLGGLPLALDQAGAYLETTHCGVSAYLELFHSRRVDLLRSRGEGARDHPGSVSTTFMLALTSAASHHPAVWDLLRVCTLLQPDAIPEELFRQEAGSLGPTLETVCRDPLEWDRMIAVACSSSLLSRQSEERTLSLHRLVQAVLLDMMKEAEREMWNGRAIEALNMLFPEVRSTTVVASRKQAERLRPHVLLCLSRVEATKDSLVFASLAYKMAQYLCECGEYVQAQPFLQRALSIREHLLGPDHPEVTHPLNSLAVLSWNQGKYAEAEPLCRRVISIWEHALGPDPVEIARPLNNLAILYWNQGRYAEAEPLCLRALSILERSKGSDHLDIVPALNNLAGLYLEQGQYTQAEPLLQRALSMREKDLGPDHPLVASSLNNLAELYRLQDRSTQAEVLYLRALLVREQVLTPDHPDVAFSLNSLAECYSMQGRYAQAEALYQRAHSIWVQTLGPDHPYVALVLNNFANLCREQEDPVQAEAFYQKALAIQEQHLGSQHPNTAQTLHDFAIHRQKQGNLSEALAFAERALKIRSQRLGDAHPKTMITRAFSTRLREEQMGTIEEAMSELRVKREKEHDANKASSSPRKAGKPSPSENDPLQTFLDACCELHPRAWCRSADLWQTYERWVEKRQERYPLSRTAFTQQLKACGCQAGRTNAARIWRGITLLNRKTVTGSDRE